MRPLILILLLASTAQAHSDHFAQLPDFRSHYPAERVYTVPAGETKPFPSGDWDLVWIEGTCVAPRNESVALTVREIVVTPTGHLDLGTPTDPVLGNVAVTFADGPLHGDDPGQWGRGLLVFGKLDVCGRAKQSWVELSAALKAGDTAIPATGEGWTAGDTVGIPATDKLTLGGGTTVYKRDRQYMLSGASALHQGVTFARPFHEGVVGPVVANLTRNIVFKSQNPAGVRGHSIFADHADVQLRYCSFNGMGRTTGESLGPDNLIGRYPVHFHHCWGVPRESRTDAEQFIVEGVVVDGVDHRSKWGIVVHNSHWGRISDCVATRVGGGGFVTEDGMELGTKFLHSLAFDIPGHRPADHEQALIQNQQRPGASGAGFWLASAAGVFEDNLAINCRFGFQTAIAALRPGPADFFVQVPAYPGGPATFTMDRMHTTLSFKRNRAVCNDKAGYDCWGNYDLKRVRDAKGAIQLDPNGRPLLIEDSIFAFNGDVQVRMSFDSNSNLFARCEFIGSNPARGIGIECSVSYFRNIYCDNCSFRDLLVGSATGRSTIFKDCDFKTGTGIVGSKVESQDWEDGMTLSGNTFSGESIRLTNVVEGFTVADIPPSMVTLEGLRGGVATWRANALGGEVPTPDPTEEIEKLNAEIAALESQRFQLIQERDAIVQKIAEVDGHITAKKQRLMELENQ